MKECTDRKQARTEIQDGYLWWDPGSGPRLQISPEKHSNDYFEMYYFPVKIWRLFKQSSMAVMGDLYDFKIFFFN